MTLRPPNTCLCTPLLKILFLLIALRSWALAAEGNDCHSTSESTEICEIPLSIKGQTAVYEYEKRPGAAGAPTVVLLPGGPGQGFIGTMKKTPGQFLIPDNYGVILIDYRGTGKNDFGPDTDGQLYTSQNVAADIVEVLKKENLSQSIILASSYGTVVATHLGHMLSRQADLRPKTIILTGVMGKSSGDVLLGANQQIDRLFSYYTADQKQKIKDGLQSIRMLFGPDEYLFSWSLYHLIFANREDAAPSEQGQVKLKSFFDELSVGKQDSSHPGFEYFKLAARKASWMNPRFRISQSLRRRSDMAEVIKCQELTPNISLVDLQFDFETGHLVSKISDCAEKGYTMDRAFDSAQFQIVGIPLVYVQGLLDSATPLSGALYHLGHQRTDKKTFIQLNQFPHYAFAGLKGCEDAMWTGLARSSFTEFNTAIRSCLKAGMDSVVLP